MSARSRPPDPALLALNGADGERLFFALAALAAEFAAECRPRLAAWAMSQIEALSDTVRLERETLDALERDLGA